ncbi:hypothetical protein [Dialister sp.]|jgi:hypothetical protein|uniref:hypothetical protein n=1 Tax=Dialister sp. TaxID=1955814 RepID=UPI003A5BA5A8
MSGDKVKRLRAVRKWLEKAENSYSSHKEITGEINLIMAQAEMERLKETHGNSKSRKRVLQIGALIAAFGVFLGLNAIWQVLEPSSEKTVVPVQVVQEKETVPAVKQEEPEHPALAAEAVKTTAPASSVSAEPVYTAPAEVTPQAAAPQPAVTASQPTAPPVRTAAAAVPKPALSDKEIQSVVGEAGRALRGQG